MIYDLLENIGIEEPYKQIIAVKLALLEETEKQANVLEKEIRGNDYQGRIKLAEVGTC